MNYNFRAFSGILWLILLLLSPGLASAAGGLLIEPGKDDYTSPYGIFFSGGYDSLIKSNIGAHLVIGEVSGFFIPAAVGWDINMQLGTNGYTFGLGRTMMICAKMESPFLLPAAGFSAGLSWLRTWDECKRYEDPIMAMGLSLKGCMFGITATLGAYKEVSTKENIYRIGLSIGF